MRIERREIPEPGLPFLAVPVSEWLAASRFAFAVADRFQRGGAGRASESGRGVGGSG